MCFLVCRLKPEQVRQSTVGWLTVQEKYGRRKEAERFGKEQEVSLFSAFLCEILNWPIQFALMDWCVSAYLSGTLDLSRHYLQDTRRQALLWLDDLKRSRGLIGYNVAKDHWRIALCFNRLFWFVTKSFPKRIAWEASKLWFTISEV